MPMGKGTYGSQVGRPPKKGQSLLKQYEAAEKELEDIMDNIPKGGLSKKKDDRARQLRSLLSKLGTQLSDMPDTEKRFP
jgi:hypothetical protein